MAQVLGQFGIQRLIDQPLGQLLEQSVLTSRSHQDLATLNTP